MKGTVSAPRFNRSMVRSLRLRSHYGDGQPLRQIFEGRARNLANLSDAANLGGDFMARTFQMHGEPSTSSIPRKRLRQFQQVIQRHAKSLIRDPSPSQCG